MFKIITALFISFTLLLSNAFSIQEKEKSLDEQIDTFLTTQKEKYQLPALVMALVKNDKIIYSKALGYADIEKKTPMTIDSKFPIMSITKTLTATHMMQLWEKGKLRLDDNIETFVPEFKVKNAEGRPANTTLLQLSMHKAGLVRNAGADINYFMATDRWYLSDGKEEMQWFISNKELLAALENMEMAYPAYHFVPFGRHYSNAGYALLGMALQKINGENITQIIKKNILLPLKMNQSGFINEKGITSQLANGYVISWKSKKPLQTPKPKPDAENTVIAAGGMYSTARDMARYITFQLEKSQRFDSILTNQSKNMMHSLNIGWSYTYYPAFSLVSHDGAFLGYRSHMAFSPEHNVGWIVFINSNSQQGAESGLNFYSFNSKIAQLLKKTIINQNETQLDNDTIIGIYRINGGEETLEIKQGENGLYTTYLKDLLDDPTLKPAGGNKFYVKGKGTHNIAYTFTYSDKMEKVVLNMGPFKWYKVI